MRSPLVPCPSCARHVAADEAACPFCSSALPNDLASRAVPAARARLTRAAAFAFASSLSVAACSSGGGDSIPSGDGGTSDGGRTDAGNDSGGPAPAYGQPADDGGVAPLYGAPSDAGPDVTDDGAGGVLYGLPPPDASSD